MNFKNKINAFSFFASIFFIAGTFLFLPSAYAQESSSVSISPLSFELTANPGDVLVNKLRVYNPTDAFITIKMETEDFKAVGEAGRVVVAPEEEATYSLKRWVKTEPSEFILDPMGQKFVDFIISIPPNAEPGGKYGTVLASIAGTASEEKVSASAVVQKVGALILLTVSGEVQEKISVKEFSAPDFLENGPVPFNIVFENSGTIHLKPRGFIALTDMLGNKVKDIEFPQKNVIPGARRKINVEWPEKFLIGKYTALLVGSYGAANEPFETELVTFWVFPWKTILGILIALIIILIFFYKTRRRWRMAMRALIKGGV